MGAVGYLVTYGGLLLLGGRAGDLLGRRRLLAAGTALFAACSLAGGLAVNAGMLVGARLAQGAGAALMAPAGLSILTTTFRSGDDRTKALGVWGAISGLAAAAGVFLGGVLSQGPGWRWVLFVNLPVCALILAGACRLVPGGRPAMRAAGFDVPGAVLATGGMLLLVYSLVRAPDQGWGSARTLGELGTAGVLLAAFTVTGLRRRNPLFPFSVFRVKGLAAADAVQMIAFAAFVPVFCFLTLYMQNVLGFSPIRSGPAYLPVTAGIIAAAGISSKLSARTGTRPVIVAGALTAAAGVWYLSRIPVHGTYPRTLLPGLVIMAVGIGAVLVSVTTAANAGVPADKAGLAAGLLNTSQQLGTALGLAIFSAIATARTTALLAAPTPPDTAITQGFHRALLACAIFLLAAAVIGMRAANSRGTGTGQPAAMNITVFGASGGIGGHVTALAAQRGHHVRAVYRQAPAAPPAGAETVIAPDIFGPGFVLRAVTGAGTVVCAVGPNFTTRHNPRTAMTSPPDLHQRLARTLIAAIRDSCPRARLICVSTASMGPADNVMGPAPRLLFRFFRTVAVPNLGRVGKDLTAMEAELAASGLDWHAPRPVKLTDGPLTRNVRASDRVTVKPVSRADVAWHILTLAEDPDPGPLRTPVITAGPGRKNGTSGK